MGETTSSSAKVPSDLTQPAYAPISFFYVPQLQPVYVAKTGKDIYTKSPVQSQLYTEYAHGTGKVSLTEQDQLPRKNKKQLQLEIGQESSSLYDLTLVSHGEPNHNCGEIRAKLFCRDTNSFIGDMLHRCHRAVCPICWDSWVERETKAATEKYLAGLKLLKRQNVKHQGHHIVWSVPPEEYHLSRKQLKTRLLYRMKWAGAVASAIIFHPFRFRSTETGYEVQWKHCSLNRNAEMPVVQSEAYYSPHYHTACVGYLKKSKEFYDRFRWRYYKQNTIPLNNEDLVRRMLWYSLSHCAVADQKHALSWAQKFGNRHMLIDTRTTDIEYPKCPIKKCKCGNKSPMVIEYQRDLAEYITAGQREAYWIAKTKTTYKFRTKDP